LWKHSEIEFVTVGGSSPIEIDRRLINVYGEDAVNVSSVGRWVRHFKNGGKKIGYRPRKVRPAPAATKDIRDKVNALIWDDRPIKTANCVR
jgi:hypothetical protein